MQIDKKVFDEILNSNKIFLLKNYLKNDKEMLNIYIDFVNNNPDKLIYSMIINGFDIKEENIKEEKIFDTIKIIIKELLDNEKINYSDINFIDSGAYSYVFEIGSKVLKIGQKRNNFVIDNNPRFLKPLLRTEINKLNSDEILGCIEITEKVNTDNITEEDVYEIYKELRDKGYIWADACTYNLGRLSKKNKVYYKDINPTVEAINYNTENNVELTKDELVIIDNDFIFTEEEFKNLSQKELTKYLEAINEYETRYKNEKSIRR